MLIVFKFHLKKEKTFYIANQKKLNQFLKKKLLLYIFII